MPLFPLRAREWQKQFACARKRVTGCNHHWFRSKKMPESVKIPAFVIEQKLLIIRSFQIFLISNYFFEKSALRMSPSLASALWNASAMSGS